MNGNQEPPGEDWRTCQWSGVRNYAVSFIGDRNIFDMVHLTGADCLNIFGKQEVAGIFCRRKFCSKGRFLSLCKNIIVG